MNFFSEPESQDTAKREEKVERISEFVSYYLERLTVCEASDVRERSVTLVARSPASPVVKGLTENLEQLIAAGVSFEVVFAQLTPSEALSEWIEPEIAHRQTFMDNDLSGTRISTVRHAAHPALAEAHEQLTLGSEKSWSGDSMRREPSKRDAYECYDIDAADAVKLARTSFANIWNACSLVQSQSASATPDREKRPPTIGTEPIGEKPVRTNKSPSAPSRH